jgi:hypothetical protein
MVATRKGDTLEDFGTVIGVHTIVGLAQVAAWQSLCPTCTTKTDGSVHPSQKKQNKKYYH